MPVHNCPGWPLYQTQDEIYIRAIKISSIDIELDGTGTAHFDDGYSPQHLSQIFLSVAKPEAGNYLFSSGYGELLYLERDKFEEMCTPASGSVRVARHIDDLVFEQPEDYSEISAVVMALQAQHNELLHALIEAGLMKKE